MNKNIRQRILTDIKLKNQPRILRKKGLKDNAHRMLEDAAIRICHSLYLCLQSGQYPDTAAVINNLRYYKTEGRKVCQPS